MNFTIALNKNVSWTEMDGQTVLFSKDTGDFFGLNPTATYLVQELLKSTFDATVGKAAATFGVESSQVGQDLSAVVSDLVEARLISQVTVSGQA